MSAGSPEPPVPPAAAPDLLDTPAAGPKAIRGSLLRGGGYTLGLLLSAGSVPFVVRHLGVEDFGRFVLITALMTVVAGTTEGGLQAIGTREYTVRAEAERDQLMRNLLGVRLVVTGVGVVLAIGFAVIAGYDRTLILGTVVAGAGLMVQSVQTLIAVPLTAELRLGWATAADLVRQVLVVSLTLALVIAGASLLPFFAVAVPASLATLALTAVLVRDATPFRPAFDRREWWVLLRDTVPYAAAIAVNVAYFRIAIILLSLLGTELETGYFATSFRVMEVLLPVPAIVVGAVFPVLARAARDDLARLRYATQRVFETSLLAGLGIALVIVLAAPTIIQIVAGDESDASIDVLRIQAPALVATFVAIAAGYPLLSLRRHRDLLVANLAALIASVGLCFALIPAHGATGAAVATTSAEVALAIVNVWLLTRTRIPLSIAVLPAALLATGLGLCTLLLPVPDLVRAGVGGVVFLAVVAAAGRIPQELLDAVRPARAAPADP